MVGNALALWWPISFRPTGDYVANGTNDGRNGGDGTIYERNGGDGTVPVYDRNGRHGTVPANDRNGTHVDEWNGDGQRTIPS